MSGLRPEEILGNESFKEYALGDSRACIRIYNELKISFPEKEFLLVRIYSKDGKPRDGNRSESLPAVYQ